MDTEAFKNLYDSFTEIKYSKKTATQATVAWTDDLVKTPESYIYHLFSDDELIPYYKGYAEMISGEPLTTAPVVDILTALITNIPNASGSGRLFQESLKTDAKFPAMKWSPKDGKSEKVEQSTSSLEAHDEGDEDKEKSSGFVSLVVEWLTDKETQHQIMCILSFHALVSLRCSIKTIESMRTAFKSEKILPLVKGVFKKINLNPTFPAIPDQYIQAIQQNLAKGSDEYTNLFKMILAYYIKFKAGSPSSAAILEAGVLRHTQGNGLGLIVMLIAAAEKYEKSVGEMVQYLLTSRTKNTCEKIISFAKLYMIEGSSQITWWWCRIIDDTQWTTLKLTPNALFVSRLAHMIITENPGILRNAEIDKFSAGMKLQGEKWAAAFDALMAEAEETEYGLHKTNAIIQKMKGSRSHDAAEDLLSGTEG